MIVFSVPIYPSDKGVVSRILQRTYTNEVRQTNKKNTTHKQKA